MGLATKQYKQVEDLLDCTAYRLNGTKNNAVEFKMHEFLHTFYILMVRLTWAAVAQTVWRLTTG